jgi:hypothetical protein
LPSEVASEGRLPAPFGPAPRSRSLVARRGVAKPCPGRERRLGWGEDGPSGVGQIDGSDRPIGGSVKSTMYEIRPTSIQSQPMIQETKGAPSMFASVTAKMMTAVCVVVGAMALLGTFFVTVTGGSQYVEFGLAVVFFAAFLVGSYWWMVFGPGRVL